MTAPSETIAAPSIQSVRDAAKRLSGVARVTPLLEAPLLNRIAGRRVLVKAECLQITGSFKFRGAWNSVSALDEATRARGVLAYSSGNHAQGVAAAAAMHGVPSVIIMPADAPALKKENTRRYGAEVIEYDRIGGESREDLGRTLTEARGLHLIKPYDDPFVISGQGVTGMEIAAQTTEAGVAGSNVLVCCGGGGLTSGVALALEADTSDWRVRPVEPAGFDDWRRSLALGEIDPNPAPSGSICDAILTPQPGEITWPIGRRLFAPGLAVSDRDARRAMAAAFRHLKIVLEPGGAVALAAALFQPEAHQGDAIVVVASGGNVDEAAFAEWTAEWRDPGGWTADSAPI